MANVIQVSKTDLSINAEIEIRVELSDLEQIVVNAEKLIGYNLANNQWIPTNEPRKFRITEFIYRYKNWYVQNVEHYEIHEQVIELTAIKGNYFLKGNKKVGGKESWLNITQNVLDQIPDEIHDHARKELNDKIRAILENILQQGVVVKAS